MARIVDNRAHEGQPRLTSSSCVYKFFGDTQAELQWLYK